MERLTRERIVALEGRELDAAVHMHVMGHDEWDTYYHDESWDEETGEEYVWREGVAENVPAYSSDIAAMWRVVERMRERGYRFQADLPNDFRASTHATFFGPHDVTHRATAEADALSTAICRAALLAVMGEEQ